MACSIDGGGYPAELSILNPTLNLSLCLCLCYQSRVNHKPRMLRCPNPAAATKTYLVVLDGTSWLV